MRWLILGMPGQPLAVMLLDMNVEHTTTPSGLEAVRVDTVTLSTGIRTRYTLQGNAEGEPLVFLHGWPDSKFSFSRVISVFDPQRIAAYSYDQRGFGDSDRPRDGYAVDRFAADAVAFLDAVGIARATLIGHSFGSFVARRAAELYPRRVARLVLIGSAVTPLSEVTREVLLEVQGLEDPIPLEFVREFQASTLHMPVPEPFFDGLVSESRKAPVRVWRDTFANLLQLDDAAELARITAPTLIVWGEYDGIFGSRSEQERLASLISGARLSIYADTGHSPNWERPERVARDIQAFMA